MSVLGVIGSQPILSFRYGDVLALLCITKTKKIVCLYIKQTMIFNTWKLWLNITGIYTHSHMNFTLQRCEPKKKADQVCKDSGAAPNTRVKWTLIHWVKSQALLMSTLWTLGVMLCCVAVLILDTFQLWIVVRSRSQAGAEKGPVYLISPS